MYIKVYLRPNYPPNIFLEDVFMDMLMPNLRTTVQLYVSIEVGWSVGLFINKDKRGK